ncbi:MAG: hypothetical protein O2887_05800 [Bacteroidetes bacterium]|nr:hypothetical protein [Bacteroidota bacterium]MDA1119995.1 hypothetical protein [Bacteroidota bacterium]
MLLDSSSFLLFFGRFHPLIVHLPIGFIILAGIFELISWKKKVDLNLAITYGLLIGAIFGIIAIILGLMLASDGGYNDGVLNIHKWTGISTAAFSSIAYFFKINFDKINWAQKAYRSTLILTLVLLSVTGHYGGNLTHGSTYLLEYAPNSIRLLAGLKPPRDRITVLDSALVYEDVVHYIFESKCIVCHNSDKAKGELLLLDPESILQGGENGPIITAGDPSESELFRRITLDSNHDDFMPSEGRTPLTKEETSLLEWWIEEGTPFDKKVIDLVLSDRIKNYLKEIGIGKELSFLESLVLPSVSQGIYDSIAAEGFRLKTISGNSSWFEVSYSSYNSDELTKEKLSILLLAKENITWMNLSGTSVQDDWLSDIGQFTNLTELRINNTQITNEGIKHLVALEHLEYLNVYATQLTDDAAESILQLSGLKKLYIWQTKITPEGAAEIMAAAPELKVETGI